MSCVSVVNRSGDSETEEQGVVGVIHRRACARICKKTKNKTTTQQFIEQCTQRDQKI